MKGWRAPEKTSGGWLCAKWGFAEQARGIYESANLPPMPEFSVAVIGASQDRRKYGNKAVRAYRECGYTVFPVNPKEATIEGLTAYPKLDAIDAPIDFVSLYVPPAVGLQLLPAIAAKQPKELWLNPGSESDELIEAAADLHLRTLVACSIVALGMSPAEFPDT
jgi:predicted CoA-binding protein